MIDRSRGRETSAVASTTGYIINLGVAAIVVTLLLMQGQSSLQTISATSTEVELEVTAERISSLLTEADRLQRTGHDSEGEVPFETFDLISGQLSGYEVNVTDSEPDERGEIIVRPSRGTEEIEVRLQYNVDNTVHGGEFTSAENPRITFNESGVHVR